MARVSIRWPLPMLLLLALASLTTYNFWFFEHQEFADLAAQNRGRLGGRLSILTGTLRHAYSSPDLSEVQREIEARRGFDAITELMLVDDRGLVLASLSPADVGRRWETVSAAAERRSGIGVASLPRWAIASDAGPVVAFSPDELHAVGAAPVSLGSNRIGFVYCWHDLRPLHEAAFARVVRRTLWSAGGLAAGALAVGLLMEFLVFGRIGKLAAAAQKVAAGDHHHELPRGGPREIGALNDSLRDMVGDIVSSEDRLLEREALLSTVLESMPAAIALRDETGHLYYANQRLRIAFGVPDDYAGRRIAELLPPEAAEYIVSAGEAALDAGGSVREEVIPGTGARTWLVHRTPLAGKVGKPRRLLVVALDITERVALEAQVLQMQKLDAVGRMVAGIAHDFNNFLTIMLGNANLLESVLPEGVARERAREIGDAAQLASALTRRLVGFAREQAGVESIVDAAALVRGFARLLRALLGERIPLALELAPGSWPVRISAGKLEQVLLNLAANARDAMPSGGPLTIRLAGAASDPARRGVRWLKLEAVDAGEGMSPEVRARALEAFFTTKPIGRGTGLGLSVCQDIVSSAGGRLEIESELGRGTLVRVLLPLAAAEDAEPEA